MINGKKRYASVRRGECVACGSCADVCPRGAVKITNGCCAEVDLNFCIGCGRCEMVCPAGAVVMEVRQ